jgi:Fic family protein
MRNYPDIYQIPDLPRQYLEVIEAIEQLKAQLRTVLRQQPRRWTGLLRRSTFARAIQGSNSIEGYNVTDEDALAAVEGEEPLDPKTEAWSAVQAYRTAMSYIVQLADDAHFSYNDWLIRSLHYMMLHYDLSKNPGRWRPGTIFVRRQPSQEIVYEGPDVELIPDLVQQLVNLLNERSKMPMLVRAALAHLNLVMIHPFSDGNGRMARALQTLVLARDGLLDPRFASIEEYLGHHTQDYYLVLAEVGQGAWHPEINALPWIKFCLTAHYRQAETLLRRRKELERICQLIEQELKSRGLHERMLMALADAAMGYRVRNATYRHSADVSDEVATKDLQLLAKEGLLIPKGERRGRTYAAGPWLNQIRAESQEPMIITDPFTSTSRILRR